MRWGQSPARLNRTRQRQNNRVKLQYLRGRLAEWAENNRVGRIPAVRTWFPGMEETYRDYGVTEDMYIQQYGHGFPRGSHREDPRFTEFGGVAEVKQPEQPQTDWERANDPRWMSMCRLEHMCIVDGHKLLPEEDWFEHCITHAREHFGRRTNLATPAKG